MRLSLPGGSRAGTRDRASLHTLLNNEDLIIPQEYYLRPRCPKSHANPSLSRVPAQLPLGINSYWKKHIVISRQVLPAAPLTQIHHSPAHPYRRLSGIIVIINKHMKYSNRAKVKCFCLARQKHFTFAQQIYIRLPLIYICAKISRPERHGTPSLIDFAVPRRT